MAEIDGSPVTGQGEAAPPTPGLWGIADGLLHRRLGGRRTAASAERKTEPEASVFARESFTEWWARRDGPRPGSGDPATVPPWPNTLNDHFHTAIAKATVRVLEDAGFIIAAPTAAVCCGLAWIAAGRPGTAPKVLKGRPLDVLRPWLTVSNTGVGLGPCCAAVLRSDAPQLPPEDDDVQSLAGSTEISPN
ncbi:(Fe-S)-binding protein [Streptomyces sp. NPDC005840]|uniref:(Fe-S)-binding protein n=1 Tax=Streptomyces sp. NPDC005840 TaxID=3157072 RepID=UPI00340E14CB